MSTKKVVSGLLMPTLAAFALIASAAAQDAPASGEPQLRIHGYLTQAYAASDGNQFLGIPDDGTADYRRLALQFRYAATDDDNLVVQLAQRRLGDSPLRELEPDVKVDWAYYQHRFRTETQVRAGRMPVPRGLLNEIRYVGTLLPFYRVPYDVYQEGSFTSETIDGVGVRQTVGHGGWKGEIDGYAGESTMLELTAAGANQTPAKKAFGGQIALTMPLDGLRLVAGAQRMDLRKTALVADGRDTLSSWNVGGEYVNERFRLRAEYSPILFKRARLEHRAYYVYGGLNVTHRLMLNGQIENATLTIPTGPSTTADVDNFHRDLALGATYAFRPDVVLKGEHHWANTHRTETANAVAQRVSPSAPAEDVNYFIVSLSASF
jgi:hypothetical protein